MLNQNIKYLREKQAKLGQAEFGKLFGLNRGKIASYEGKSEPPIKVLKSISRHFKVSVDDLINKNLSVSIPSKKEEVSLVTEPTQKYSENVVVTVNDSGKENIVMVDVKAAAGYSKSLSSPSFFKELPAFSLPGREFRNATFRAFQVDGDSMYDTLDHGDWVICRYLEHGFNEIKEGYIHVLITQDEVCVKRLLNRKKERGKIVMISDNEAYPPKEVEVSDVKEIWIVKGRLGFNLRSRRMNFLKQLSSLQSDMLDLRNRVTKIEKKK